MTIRTVAETGSTNDDLLADEQAGEGDWLRAVRQSGGRGRQGRAWQSPPGNLHASTLVLLSPGDPPPGTLALVAAVALHEAVAIVAPGNAVRIKWPNDLILGNAKLAGILLERVGQRVVAGFGVNVVAAPEVPGRATTSLAALGVAADAGQIAALVSERFAHWLAVWHRGALQQVRVAWLAAAHPPGTALSVATGEAAGGDAAGERIDGLFDGLDSDGALRLRLADGGIRAIHAGDVFVI